MREATPATALIRMPTAGNSFLYEQVARMVREQIERGELLPGQRAPSLRSLQRELDISLASAQQAYAHQ